MPTPSRGCVAALVGRLRMPSFLEGRSVMAEVVYLLCAATSIVCAVLLYRGYTQSRTRLLFWSSLCFAGLALNNVLLFVDLVVLPTTVDLTVVRSVPGLAGIWLLVYGLVKEAP